MNINELIIFLVESIRFSGNDLTLFVLSLSVLVAFVVIGIVIWRK
ncbi:hypothetical protein ACI6PX_19650 [Proteus sp. NGCRVN-01]|nr:hypothetical protein [Proteus mirabilis]MCU9582488.1 hypothetical protein [Proteus mirabilis]